MKTTAVLALLVFVSCASNDGFQTRRNLDCAPGQPVTIEMTLQNFRASGMEGVDDQHTLAVVVANNSHEDIVLDFIRIDQRLDDTAIYRMESGYQKFDLTIPEGKDVEVKIPMSGRPVPSRAGASTAHGSDSILLDVTTALGNGDRYQCRFEIPIR